MDLKMYYSDFTRSIRGYSMQRGVKSVRIYYPFDFTFDPETLLSNGLVLRSRMNHDSAFVLERGTKKTRKRKIAKQLDG